MNIKEARIKKGIIENQILTLIKQFEKDTNLEASCICLEKVYNTPLSNVLTTINVNLEVKL